MQALRLLQHYFENPETSVMAEQMLDACDADPENCAIMRHLDDVLGKAGVQALEQDADADADEEGRRRLAQAAPGSSGEKVPNEGNPDTKVPFFDVPPAPPSVKGLVSAFQYYRDEYCTPPSVNGAEFNFIGSTNFQGVVYAFAIVGGSATWDSKTQQLAVQKPQVVYSKRPASVSKDGGSTSKGGASDKSCR